MKIAERLKSKGHLVVCHDFKARPAGLSQISSVYAAAKGADAIALMNDEPPYRRIDWKRVVRSSPQAKIFAASPELCRNIPSALEVALLGGRR